MEKLLKKELSGTEALKHIDAISKFHRIAGSSDFHSAVTYCVQCFKECSLDEVRVDKYPLNGKYKALAWTLPMAWEVEDVGLRVVEPVEEAIINFNESPSCIYCWSGPTPLGGVTAELVYVGSGVVDEDYKAKDVQNKIVLAEGIGATVYNLAVKKHGAIGVVTSFILEAPPILTREKYPDLVQFMSLDCENGEPNKCWVISISYNRFLHLKELLEKGPVKVKAEVDAKFFEGELENVVGVIRGTEKQEEEIILIAHLCHSKPGANDNASGCGLVLEIARTISKLIKEGRIARPTRSIKFILCAEMLGSNAYVKNYWRETKNAIAVLCLDMVGEDQIKCMGPLILNRTPDSLPSFLPDYCVSLLERLPKEVDVWGLSKICFPFRFEEIPYFWETDVYVFSDADVGVPAIFLSHWPDIYYHTQLDTVDKVDPEELKRVGWVTATAALILASGGAKEAISIMNEVEAKSEQRLSRISMQACEEVLSIAKEKASKKKANTEILEMLEDKKNEMRHFLTRDLAAIDSTMTLVKGEDGKKTVDSLRKRFRNRLIQKEKAEVERIESLIEEGVLPSNPHQNEEGKRLVPKRGKIKGPIPIDELESKTTYSFMHPIIPYLAEIYNYINGKRTIADIYEETKYEYGPIFSEKISQEDMSNFIKTLEKIGYVLIERKKLSKS